MAHNIEFNEKKGTYSFVEANKNQIAWHRLGKRFDQDGITATDAIVACNADFQVSKQPIVALTPEILDKMANGEPITSAMLEEQLISGKMATMRLDTNKSLGIVSEHYGIVQNQDAFRFVDAIVSGSVNGQSETPCIDCAGLLGNGERIFVTAKFPTPIVLDNHSGDQIDLYLVFTTSHDGSGAVNAMVTPIRVVCNNTLNLAFKENSGKLSMRHTSGIMSRLDLTNADNATMALKSLNLYTQYRKTFEEKIAQLRSIKVTDKQAKEVMALVTLPTAQLDIYRKTNDLFAEGISSRSRNLYQASIKSLYEGIGQGVEEGNGLWLVNGISTLYQNHTNNDTTKNGTKMFDSITSGKISEKVNEVMNIIFALNTANALSH